MAADWHGITCECTGRHRGTDGWGRVPRAARGLVEGAGCPVLCIHGRGRECKDRFSCMRRRVFVTGLTRAQEYHVYAFFLLMW